MVVVPVRSDSTVDRTGNTIVIRILLGDSYAHNTAEFVGVRICSSSMTLNKRKGLDLTERLLEARQFVQLAKAQGSHSNTSRGFDLSLGAPPPTDLVSEHPKGLSTAAHDTIQ